MNNFQKLKPILFMLVSSLCLCVGQFIWKIMPDYNILYIICGFIIYSLGGMALIFAFRFGDLSILQPLNSISYVFAAILGYFFLKETIQLLNIIGLCFIMCGVVIIGINK